MMKKMLIGLAGLMLSLTGTGVSAQGDPLAGKTLRVIVPFGPGSAVDAQGRFYAELLAKAVKASAYVENKPGANGVLGLNVVKSAPADGLTLAVVSPSLVVVPIMSKSAGYKLEDFTPIAGIGKGPIGFFVRADSKYASLADMLTAAKKDKHSINIGTYAGSYQIGAAWLSILSGVSLNNIPYKGASFAMTDLIGGNLELMSADFNAMMPLVREGKLRALAVASEKRAPELPKVATVRETYPDYVNYIWTGLVVRADTPPAIVARLSQAMQEVLASKESLDFIAKQNWELLNLDSAGMTRFLQAENRRFKDVAKSAGIHPE